MEESPSMSRLTDYVESVAVDIGDRVKKDQVLLRNQRPEDAKRCCAG